MRRLAVASVVGIQPNLFNSLTFRLSFLHINLLFFYVYFLGGSLIE